MPIKRTIPLTAINGVAANATATINIPVGSIRYHSITLGYKTATTGGATEATMKAEITEIRLVVNGVVQRKMSPADLFNLNRQKGKAPTVSASTAIPGYLTFYFSEPQRKTNFEREATAWGTNNVNTFQIQIDIAAGASSPVLSGFALVDDVSQPMTNIVKWKKETVQVSATGVVNYTLDTSKSTDSYQDLTLVENTAGDITNILLTWEGVVMYQDDSNYAVERLNESDYTRVSGYRHIPLCGNSLNQVIPTIRKDTNGNLVKVGSFLLQTTMGAANSYVAIREVLGLPD